MSSRGLPSLSDNRTEMVVWGSVKQCAGVETVLLKIFINTNSATDE